MFTIMIPECMVLSSIGPVMMWSIAVAVVLVTLVALCIRGKNPLWKIKLKKFFTNALLS